MNRWLSYILVIISICGITYIHLGEVERVAKSSNIELITKKVNSELSKAQETLTKLQKQLKYKDFKFEELKYSDKDIFIYEKSKLKYWSHNKYDLDELQLFLKNSSIFIQDNEYGKFIIVKGTSLNFSIAIAVPLYRKYETNNTFIRSKYNEQIFGNLNVTIDELGDEIFYNKRKLFNIRFNGDVSKEYNNLNSFLHTLFVILLLIFSSLGIYQNNLKGVFKNLIVVSLIRLSLIFLPSPNLGGILYDPTVFASSLIHSNLSEFFINIIYVCIVFYLFNSLLIVRKKYSAVLVALIVLFMSIFLYDIIMNSVFIISPYNLLSFKIESWLVLLPILLISLVSCVAIVKLTHENEINLLNLQFLIVQVFFVGILFFANVDILLPYVLFSVLVYIYFLRYQYFNLQLFYFLCLFVLALTISNYKFKKENSDQRLHRLAISANIFEGSDPYLEYLINDVSERISKDKIIISKLKSPLTSANGLIKKKIEKVYLQKYFEGYDFDVKIVSIDQIVKFPHELIVNDEIYKVDKKEFNDLYQVQKQELTPYRDYIKLVWFDEANLVKNIFIRFTEKEINRYSVIPQLLFDEGKAFEPLDEISYALINSEGIKYQSGEYKYYEENANDIIDGKLDNSSFNHNVITEGDQTLILSTRKTSIREFFDYFSFISIILIVTFFVWYASTILWSNRRLKFAERVQIAMSLFVLLNIISILFILVSSFNSTYKEQIASRYSEIANNVSRSLNNMLSKKHLDRGEISDKLFFMARNQNVDIHIYNNEGTLLMSSLPEIFEKKLLSKKIKYTHFIERSTSVSNESIGDFKYSSAYSPIIKDKKQFGIVNIPFFSSDEELMTSIDKIIFSIFDISLLIICLFLIISGVLSSRITKPLKLLKENMDLVSLEENKHIDWNSDDEIGMLVKSYNTMLNKLSQSKEKLKEQEKQSAWKEMARQVAHEIKNPLTPMKLSLQFLQRKMGNSTEENVELSKSTEAIISQIDNLTDIVNSFSEFATMPAYELQKVDIQKLLEETVNFHNKTVTIEFYNFKQECIVKCDKKALKGILTNIIINGIQSVKDKEPLLKINCNILNDYASIAIGDNGGGIAKEIRNKVFVPNFSTKYTGSGIGLALAKQGIEHFGGKIRFETKLEVGTTFYIELPLSQNA